MVINVNEIYPLTDGYPVENQICMFNIRSVWHRVNLVKGLEILDFLFMDGSSSHWISLNQDIELDWTEKVSRNIDNGYYSEKAAKFLLSPMPQEHKDSINAYLKYRGMDFIFDKIQKNYDMIYEDGDDSFIEFGKDHCRECIEHVISGV